MQLTKVLLDTDMGSNLDDALCLAYLLSHPACELVGITTVSGRPLERAMLCSALCKAAARDVPIYPGVEDPLVIVQRQPSVPQAAALERWPHETDFPRGEAVLFMRDVIRKHPREITLLAIGPLTNVALLLRLDPEIPHLLAGLVIMGGVFSNLTAGAGPCERNCISDPHAAAMVYNSTVRIHRSIGLDVTRRVNLPRAELCARGDGARLLEVTLDWGPERDPIGFNDPLAAATIFDDTLCDYARGRVSIELESSRLRGLTHFEHGTPGAHHDVATGVDVDRFFQQFFTVF